MFTRAPLPDIYPLGELGPSASGWAEVAEEPQERDVQSLDFTEASQMPVALLPHPLMLI